MEYDKLIVKFIQNSKRTKIAKEEKRIANILLKKNIYTCGDGKTFPTIFLGLFQVPLVCYRCRDRQIDQWNKNRNLRYRPSTYMKEVRAAIFK